MKSIYLKYLIAGYLLNLVDYFGPFEERTMIAVSTDNAGSDIQSYT